MTFVRNIIVVEVFKFDVIKGNTMASPFQFLSDFYTRKLLVRIELTTLRVLVRMLLPLSNWTLYGDQGRNLIIITPVIEDCTGDLLEIGRPVAYKTKSVRYNYTT